jgi:polar amino acid transport system substrate-binding protein
MGKIRRIFALTLVIALVAAIFGACAKKNESDSAYVQEKGTLIVGITDYAPMDYKEKGSDEWTGFDAELATIVAKKLGVKVEFLEIEWDNKFFELKTKGIDCIWNGMTITEEVENNTSVSAPYARNRQVVVMKKEKAADYTNVESIKELKFAVEKGSSGEGAAEDNSLEFTAVGTQSDTLLEVKSGTADAAIIDSVMADAMTGEGTDYSDLAEACTLSEEQFGIGFRQGSDLKDKVDEIISQLKADGTMASLSEKYGVELMD